MSIVIDEIEKPVKYNVIGILVGLLTGVIASLFVMGLGVGIIFAYRSNEETTAKSRSLETVSLALADMKSILTDSIATTTVLNEVMILHNYTLTVPEFLDTTSRLRAKHSIIDAYEYAHGIDLPLILIDPIDSPVLGLKLMLIPLQAQQMIRAINNNTITIYGPVSLIEGGISLIGINPIFYRNGSFYGVSLVLISLNKLLTIINMPLKFRYTMSNQWETFYNNTIRTDIDSVVLKINIYGELWIIHVFSIDGWYSDPYVWIETIALMLCMSLTIVLFILMFRSIGLGLYSKHMAVYFRNEFELEFRSRMKDLISDNTRSDAIVLSTSDGNIMDVEGNVAKYLLYQPSELIGKSISSLFLSKRCILDKNGYKKRCMYTLSDNKYTILVDSVTDSVSQ